MGMQYNVTFHNATIKRETLAGRLEIAPDSRLFERHALDYLSNWLTGDPACDDEGVHLDGCGYWDSASYGFGDELKLILEDCEPGAYFHEIDEEECSGEQWRVYKMPDGTLKTVIPEIVWPELPELENVA